MKFLHVVPYMCYSIVYFLYTYSSYGGLRCTYFHNILYLVYYICNFYTNMYIMFHI